MDRDIPLIRQFKRAMAKYQHDAPISFTSLEGFIAGKLVRPDRPGGEGGTYQGKFISTMEEVGEFDLGGLILRIWPTGSSGDGHHLFDPDLSELWKN